MTKISQQLRSDKRIKNRIKVDPFSTKILISYGNIFQMKITIAEAKRLYELLGLSLEINKSHREREKTTIF